MKVVNTHPRRTFGARWCAWMLQASSHLWSHHLISSQPGCVELVTVSPVQLRCFFTFNRRKLKGSWHTSWFCDSTEDTAESWKEIHGEKNPQEFSGFVGESASLGQTFWSLAQCKTAGNAETMRARQMAGRRRSPQVFNEINMQLSSSFHYFLSSLLKKKTCDFTVLITHKKKNSCM